MMNKDYTYISVKDKIYKLWLSVKKDGEDDIPKKEILVERLFHIYASKLWNKIPPATKELMFKEAELTEAIFLNQILQQVADFQSEISEKELVEAFADPKEVEEELNEMVNNMTITVRNKGEVVSVTK